MRAVEIQKVHLYKYFCILWAFRILSPETISVMWNIHSSWQKLPSGFCPWHSTKRPGEVTGDASVARSCGFLCVAGDTLTTSQNPFGFLRHPLVSFVILWFPLSSVCAMRALCLAWVSFWSYEDGWAMVFTLQEIHQAEETNAWLMGSRCFQWCVRSWWGSHFQGVYGEGGVVSMKRIYLISGERHVKFKITPNLLIDLIKKLSPYYSLVENQCRVMGGITDGGSLAKMNLWEAGSWAALLKESVSA